MSKPVQVLNIDPPTEITFTGPFTDVVTSHLLLKNPSEKQVCFKVKTTAPKQYCVRPNSGLIPPGGNVSVAVMLQPLDSSTGEQERSKHKFMVQSAFVPDGETSLERIWKGIQVSDLMDSKLRVVFDSLDMQDINGEKTVKSGVSPAKLSLESDFRREMDEKKRLMSNLGGVERDNNELRQRLKRMEEGDRMVLNDQGVPLIHVILITLAALLVGLILGKLF